VGEGGGKVAEEKVTGVDVIFDDPLDQAHMRIKHLERELARMTRRFHEAMLWVPFETQEKLYQQWRE
jgi:hypothetical protein